MTRRAGMQARSETLDAHPGAALAPFAGTVADIARTLESPHDSESRMRHVLSLVGKLIPCDRCALYQRSSGAGNPLMVVPQPAEDEASWLAAFLKTVLGVLDGEGETPKMLSPRPHLALPVIGLDEILGVLFIDRAHAEEYAPHDLRLLSAVASQLGAYLTMGRLHQETVEQTRLLREREQQLRGAARFREEFIGVVGHDLRNPLSAIRTGVGLLTKRAALEGRDRRVAERIVSSADRMSRMIDELMDFARGRLGGGIPLRRTVVDLHALCTDVAEEAQAAEGRMVHLRVSGDPRGYWDSDRLAQLLSNLVGNALQHSPPASVVRVSVRDEHEYAVVEVRNEGTPIPSEQLSQMFEPFRRGDKTESTGLGLGLYIVERIVHAHGGRIGVASTAAAGTTFTVHLPRRRGTDRQGVERQPHLVQSRP